MLRLVVFVLFLAYVAVWKWSKIIGKKTFCQACSGKTPITSSNHQKNTKQSAKIFQICKNKGRIFARKKQNEYSR